jgi:hypothetical protein
MAASMASSSLAGARASYAAPKSRATLGRKMATPTRARAVTTYAGKTPDGPKVAIAGISGAVGQEFIRVRRVSPHRLRSTVVSFCIATLSVAADDRVCFPTRVWFLFFFLSLAQRCGGCKRLTDSLSMPPPPRGGGGGGGGAGGGRGGGGGWGGV